jgi:hypothetical protein
MAKFRETLWFKRGELEQPVADETPHDLERPIEDRYLDDGSVSDQDSSTYSVRTRGTDYIPLIAKSSTEDVAPVLVAELKGSRRRVVAAIGASFAMVCAVVVLYAL